MIYSVINYYTTEIIIFYSGEVTTWHIVRRCYRLFITVVPVQVILTI